jgi:hypothetical protein
MIMLPINESEFLTDVNYHKYSKHLKTQLMSQGFGGKARRKETTRKIEG